MQLPSGRTLSSQDERLIRGLNRVGFIRWNDEPFTLKSGILSHVYVFGREDITDHPYLLNAIGVKIATMALDAHGPRNPFEGCAPVYEGSWQEDTYRTPCLIGIPVAGTTMALAAAIAHTDPMFGVDYGRRVSLPSRMMRQVQKAHGAHHTWIDGVPDVKRHDYMSVDNVVTFGTSKFEAFERLEADGYPAKEMHHIIFIDRQQGALKRMSEAGYGKTIVCFNLLDLTYAYLTLGLWPEDAVKRVEDEIAAHQALSV